MNKKIEHIPSLSAFHFLKHAGKILKNPLPFHHKNFEKLGDSYRLHLGLGNSVVFSRDPNLAKYILQTNQKNYEKSPIQSEDMAKYIGHGLLTATGKQWQKQRKLIQPAFHKNNLKKLLNAVQEALSAEIDKITVEQPIDIFPIFNDLAFQTVVKALFSNAIGNKEIQRLQHITETIQKMLVSELRQPYLHWWFQLSGKVQKHLDLTEEARDILKTVITNRKQGKRHDDLLDLLLDARYEDDGAMSEEQLVDEILILFAAGHETTSNALTFAAELLAREPKMQEEIYQEVKNIKDETSDLMEVVTKAEFTNRVISETMRLYPPVYFIDRISLEEDEFEGKDIPKKTSILLAVYEIHQHKEYWKEPSVFNPNRFKENPRPEAYFPFGAGPRKCIGNNFAMFEMVLAVAELVARFKIKPTKEEIEILPLITLKPKNAVLKFEKRMVD
ncbi:cytochrome P450 [Mesonia sp. MT50]|uniref:Cytochrome P450 n=1 Tax=Mesonia profundi TaxID=3070998 RepID=A0ABU1A012_9FLAO|nr:cytochrome P450 [Mesonia profundi]MDQ7916992.1 cytochrome P450 [Mesonia profundi]